MTVYDVIVIGAGVTGSAVARELSRRQGRFLVVERASDVCEGTSKANSAIVHAGFDAEPGTLKAKMNVRGNQLMDQIAQELDVPFSRVGAFVVCLREEEMPKLEELYQRGLKNGVPDLELLTGDEAKALEPNLTDEVCGALWARTSGIVCPFALTLGLAESAAKNGVEFSFDTAVTGLEQIPEGWLVKTNQGDFTARAVVNAAGVYADEVHNWVCGEKLSITPRKGEYCLLDKTAGGHVGRTIFQLPGKYGKGVLVSPTIHGNLLIGPSAEYIQSPEDTASTRQVMDQLFLQARQLLPALEKGQIIGAYAGLRPKLAPPGEGGYRDFVIREDKPGFVNLVGIESPGLTASLPIARRVAALVGGSLDLSPRADFQARRRGIRRFRDQSPAAQAALIAADPDYGEVVCRCQTVTRAELRQAVENPLGVRTLAGIKYRAWATTGRCQGGYCLPKIAQMLVEDYGLAPEDVTYRGEGSPLFAGRVK